MPEDYDDLVTFINESGPGSDRHAGRGREQIHRLIEQRAAASAATC